ncbi:MAG TPA: hypothetical protein VFN25_16215 [Dokdonella sp.]|uniref:hypothetical protein n=1 Tax=Dokdonella sp. TaxID=2291710 RepID=UPI002D809570|nr:hypothetical protein [Dokdonella sp.]HET9034436.1 hypothetical protein [Dokdonella sp.]
MPAENESIDEAAPATADSLLDTMRDALRGALQVIEASFSLLRSELRLARSSALTIVWLAFALVALGAGAWLSTIAAIALGVYQLSGNLFLGVAVVAAINLGGVVWVTLAMRRCWRDVSLPQTRALIVSVRSVNDNEVSSATGPEDA